MLDRRILLIWRLRALLVALGVAVVTSLLSVAAVVSGLRLGVALVFPLLALAVGGTLAVVVPGLAYDRWRYVVGDQSLELNHGVIVRSRSWVPWFRIQHVDVGQGPIERRLGLAHLVVHTASASTDATIPGIPAADADEMRALILSRVGRDEGV